MQSMAHTQPTLTVALAGKGAWLLPSHVADDFVFFFCQLFFFFFFDDVEDNDRNERANNRAAICFAKNIYCLIIIIIIIHIGTMGTFGYLLDWANVCEMISCSV